MTLLNYSLSVRNAGARVTGLASTLAWVAFKRFSDNTDISPPTFSEVGYGIYKFAYDAEAGAGEAIGQIDAGAGVASPAERYIDVVVPADSSRLVTMPNAILAAPVVLGAAVGTVAEALIAARAQGFGKWVLVGTALTLYGPDGTTPVRTFTLDNAAAPTARA